MDHRRRRPDSGGIVGILNALTVDVEIVIVSVLVIALTIAFATTGIGCASNLTSRGITTGDVSYFGIGGGLMLAMLMGLTTLTGFDAAANLAEEAKDPYRNVPRAIVGSVIAAGVLGPLFLIALTVAIPDIGRISRSGAAVAQILDEQLGPIVERMLLVAITFAVFACGMVVLATGSRLIYAMSRDGRFPLHRLMRQVNPPTQTPIPATLLIFAGGVLLMLAMPGKALLSLITASTIMPVLIYAATVVLYLSVRRKLGRKEGAFDPGRSELPVAISALVWLIAATFVLVTPEAASVPVLIVLGLVLIGGIFFAGMLLFDRRSMFRLLPARSLPWFGKTLTVAPAPQSLRPPAAEGSNHEKDRPSSGGCDAHRLRHRICFSRLPRPSPGLGLSRRRTTAGRWLARRVASRLA